MIGWPPEQSPDALRADIQAMAESWLWVLQAHLGEANVVGLYAKGSAVKDWDSPLDYVPEISDLDLHLRLDSDVLPLGIETALALRAAAEAEFAQRAPAATHHPRAGLVLINELEEDPAYVASPAGTVRTLRGPAYMGQPDDPETDARIRETDRRQLLGQRDALDDLVWRMLDNTGPHARSNIRHMNWRVSPVAPRVLSVLGLPTIEAWSLNRTQLIAALRDRNRSTLATAYTAYYESGWRCFRSDYADRAAVSAALDAAVAVIQEGAQIAQESA